MSLISVFAKEGEALTVGDLQNAFNSIELIPNGFFLSNCTDEDLNQLIESLENFSKLNYIDYSDDDILDQFSKALQINHVFSYTSQEFIVSQNQTLFRVREAPYKNLPCEALKDESSCWNPPEDVTPAGRLNKPHESMLYTTLGNPSICLDECHIKNNKTFMMMVYTVCDEFNISLIGAALNPELKKQISPNGVKYHQICTDFLNWFFSKPVDDDEKDYYRVSDLLAKHFFTNSEDGKRAWGYATVTGIDTRGFINICMDPPLAKQHLRLEGVVLGKRIDQNKIKVHGIVESFDDDGKPIYRYDIESTRLYKRLIEINEQNELDFEYMIK